MIEALLVDMDGTQIITEPRNRRLHETAAQKYGGHIQKSDWHFLAGTSDRIIWTHLKNTFNAFAIGQDDYLVEIEDGYLNDLSGVIIRPGMLEVFQHAADRGIPIATVTNSVSRIASNSLAKFGLDKSMRLVVTSDDMVAAGLKTKPAPDPYLFAAAALGINVKNALILEDARNGTGSAIAALGDVSNHSGRVIQIIDPEDAAQYHPQAHAHAYNAMELVAKVKALVP